MIKTGCRKVFEDKGSGSRAEQPSLATALEMLREGDTLVVWKLDRLGRSVNQLANFIDIISKKGAQYKSLTDSIDTGTPPGRFFFDVMASIAEMERELIVERTRAGLEAARQLGRKGGRLILQRIHKFIASNGGHNMQKNGTPQHSVWHHEKNEDLSPETNVRRKKDADSNNNEVMLPEHGINARTFDPVQHTLSKKSLDTPVLLMIFNRPETTQQVFEAIRLVRPRQLFVAADGPREHDFDEAQRCRAARDAALAVDWDCEVKTLLRTRNLGCKVAVSSAITWFFQHVKEGIILEDDTLPIAGFFPYCQQQLAYYREDHRVMHIGGNSYQLGLHRGDGSYYFSNYNHIWGWATWRRAWQHYHPDVPFLDSFRRRRAIEALFPNKADQDFWMQNFQRVARGEIDTWDYQWTLTIWDQHGLSLLPCVNMVSNIGIGAHATHTVGDNCLSRLPVQDPGPLVHPTTRDVDCAADHFAQRYIFSGRINNPGELVNDVASELEADRYDTGAVMAGQFLIVHPNNCDLRWLRALALAKSGAMELALGELTVLLTAHPEHPAGRSLLRNIRTMITS